MPSHRRKGGIRIITAAVLLCLLMPAALPLADYQDAETLTKVQSALAGQGYYTIPVDGLYGPATSLAIGQYQEAHGLAIDGLVTDELLRSLRLRPGSAPDLPPRKSEIHTLDFFDESLYDGTWTAISDPESGIGYEAYLPAWWDLDAWYLNNGTYSLIYEPASPQQETIAVEEILEEVSGEEYTLETETEESTAEAVSEEVSGEDYTLETETEESTAEAVSEEVSGEDYTLETETEESTAEAESEEVSSEAVTANEFVREIEETAEESSEETTETYTPEEAAAFIDMAVFQVIRHPEGTDQAASGMSFLSMVYESYEFPNTFVGECRINHFTGLSLTAQEKSGNPDYTYLFAGKDQYGEELVVSFSALSHREMVMNIFANILSSIHRIGEPRNSAPAIEPTATPTPVPTATLMPEALERSRTVSDANGIAEPEILFISSLPEGGFQEEELPEDGFDQGSYALPEPENIDSTPYVQEEGIEAASQANTQIQADSPYGQYGPVLIPASNDKPLPLPSVTPTPNPTATPSPLPTEAVPEPSVSDLTEAETQLSNPEEAPSATPTPTPTPVPLPLPDWYRS